MRRFLIAVVLVLALSAAGCQKKQEVDVEQNLHVSALSGPFTMNPIFLRDGASAEVAALLHTTLLITDSETLEPTPRLITSWELKEDNLTYIFTLHEDANWSDGTPITADDVAFTMRVISHPDYTGWLFLPLRYVLGTEGYKAEHPSLLADGDISGIQVIDVKTLAVTLKEPYAPFLSMLTFAPLPYHILGDVAVNEMEGHEFSLKLPVNSGPYRLAEWNQDEYVHVKANANYYLGKPAIDHIYYRFIPNAEAQLIELLAGNLDVIPTAVKVEDIAALEADPQVNVYTNPRLVYDYIAINTKKEDSPLNDIRVRQALSKLLDRKEIVNNVLLGYADPLYGPILPIHFAYDETLEEDTVDLAAARLLLVEAGYQRLEVRLIFNAGNLVRENVALLFKEQAAKIGIDVKVSLLEWEAFLAAINEGDFDLAILGRGVEADPDLTFHWQSESQGNSYGYTNEEVDRLLAYAVGLRENYERARIYREVQKLIVGDVPAIWLYARRAVHATNAELKNFKPHPENIFYYVHEWILAEGEDAT